MQRISISLASRLLLCYFNYLIYSGTEIPSLTVPLCHEVPKGSLKGQLVETRSVEQAVTGISATFASIRVL